MKNKDQLSAQATAIIQLGDKVLATETTGSQQKSYVEEQSFHNFRIAAMSYLGRVFGQNSVYYQSFKTEVTHPTSSRTRRGMGMVSAAQKEIQGDWLETTRGEISRETLSDMLRVAQQQLGLQNHAAAIIICGSVLEVLLRHLCSANGIPVENQLQNKSVAKKGLQLTGDAYKKKLYERQDNKAIISWIELYETASSSKSENVTADGAKVMCQGVHALLTKCKY